MKLDSGRPDFALQTRKQNLDFKSAYAPKAKQQHFQASSWVKLLELPNPYSFDEALLLCEISEDQWLAWIPDHGEAILNVRQFSQ